MAKNLIAQQFTSMTPCIHSRDSIVSDKFDGTTAPLPYLPTTNARRAQFIQEFISQKSRTIPDFGHWPLDLNPVPNSPYPLDPNPPTLDNMQKALPVGASPYARPNRVSGHHLR
jgi:hypothetical protein